MSSNSVSDDDPPGLSRGRAIPDAKAAGPSGDVRVLSRGLSVLGCFRPHNAALTNSELASLVGLPRSTISRITAMLLKAGYLEYQPERAQYRLSASVVTLGFGSVATSYARQLAREKMQLFAVENDLVVVLAVRDGLNIVCQLVLRGQGSLTVRLGEGSRIALPHGAMGRAWMASLPPREREALWDEVRKGYPNAMSRAELDEALRQFTKSGFCTALSKLEPDLLGAATVLQLPGEPEPCVLGCAVPAFRHVQKTSQEALGAKLVGLRDEMLRASSAIDHAQEEG